MYSKYKLHIKCEDVGILPKKLEEFILKTSSQQQQNNLKPQTKQKDAMMKQSM